LTESESEHLSAYIAIGRQIRHGFVTGKLNNNYDFVEHLRHLDVPRTTRIPFTFMCNSSGTGKTQQAFALPADRNVIYVPLSEKQDIYQCFRHLRECLEECLNFDLAHLIASTKDADVSHATCERYFSRPDYDSHAAGFFTWAIRHCSFSPDALRIDSPSEIVRRPTSDVMAALRDKGGNVVVMLDEIDLKKEKHRLLRNILRAWRMKVVVMSTNSSAANYVGRSGGSRGNENPQPWCYLFKDLPPAVGDPLVFPDASFPEDLKRLLRYCVEKSRPLFGGYVRDFLRKHPVVSGSPHQYVLEMLKEINERMFVTKLNHPDNTYNVLIGQHHQCMAKVYVPASGAVSKNKGDMTRFDVLPVINCHYAIFEEMSRMLFLQMNALTLCIMDGERQVTWTPKARFPTLVEEPILFLASFIHPERRFFNPDPLSFRAAHQLIAKDKMSGVQLFANPDAEAANGDVLEAAVGGACVIASQPIDRLDGVPFKPFLQELGRNLTIGVPSLSSVGLDDSLFSVEVDLRIPHFGPPGQEWPRELANLPGALFGKYGRTKNSTRVDGLGADGRLCIECKNYSTPLPKKDFDGCVERAVSHAAKHPLQPFVYCLVTNRLQAEYDGVVLVEGRIARKKAKKRRMTPAMAAAAATTATSDSSTASAATPSPSPPPPSSSPPPPPPAPSSSLRTAITARTLRFGRMVLVNNTLQTRDLFPGVVLDSRHLFIVIALHDLHAGQ